MFRTSVRIVTGMVSVFVAAASSQAGIVVPEDLQPGDTYHLVFVTVEVRDATSSNIADYNQFVNDQAALNPTLTGTDMGVEWFVIGSTATVNARDNAVVGFLSPVYLLDGTTRIADGFSDIWNGSIANTLSLDQFLVSSFFFEPWTGTNDGGIAAAPLGAPSFTTHGRTASTDGGWLDFFLTADNTVPSTFYALSAELTVPPIPEPATASLLLIGSALAWVRRRQRATGQSRG